MTAAELSALSDQELSLKVALDVAGYPADRFSTVHMEGLDFQVSAQAVPPPYATSADAVLPLIGMNYFSANRNPFNGVWTATVGAGPVFEAQDKSFARAVAIALLLAKGAA